MRQAQFTADAEEFGRDAVEPAPFEDSLNASVGGGHLDKTANTTGGSHAAGALEDISGLDGGAPQPADEHDFGPMGGGMEMDFMAGADMAPPLPEEQPQPPTPAARAESEPSAHLKRTLAADAAGTKTVTVTNAPAQGNRKRRLVVLDDKFNQFKPVYKRWLTDTTDLVQTPVQHGQAPRALAYRPPLVTHWAACVMRVQVRAMAAVAAVHGQPTAGGRSAGARRGRRATAPGVAGVSHHVEYGAGPCRRRPERGGGGSHTDAQATRAQGGET